MDYQQKINNVYKYISIYSRHGITSVMRKTIKLEEEVHKRLTNLGNLNTTYNEVVKQLLDEHDSKKGKNKK